MHDFALHVSRCGLFSQPLHAVLWIAMSGADIADCVSSTTAVVPTDPAIVQLLVAAGAKTPTDYRMLWKEPASEHQKNSGMDAAAETEAHAPEAIPASPSAGSNVSEPGMFSLVQLSSKTISIVLLSAMLSGSNVETSRAAYTSIKQQI